MRVIYFLLLILESIFVDPFRKIPYFNKFNSHGQREWLDLEDLWELSRPLPPPALFKSGVGARSRKVKR